MNRSQLGCCAALAVLLSLPMLSQAAELSPQARYEKERRACMDGVSTQSRKDCLYEAQSALRDARQGRLGGEDPQQLRANALRRCEAHNDMIERQACQRMVQGEGSVSGSVAGGGQIKEITTVIVGQAGNEVVVPAR
ncbi:MAG: hypothetical protein WAQ05_24235 [Rubrivivax sp.]